MKIYQLTLTEKEIEDIRRALVFTSQFVDSSLQPREADIKLADRLEKINGKLEIATNK